MPIITLVGWISFAMSFYFSTKDTLEAHSKQIGMILSTREKLLDKYNEDVKRITDSASEQTRTYSLRLQAIDSHMTSVDQQLGKLSTTVESISPEKLERRSDALQAQIESLRGDIRRLEEHEEKMLQALDAQYNALNDHLRSHGTGGVPRR